MPFNPLAKEYAVRLTVGSEVTWYGGDDALMDYDTAHAQFSGIAPLPPHLDLAKPHCFAASEFPSFERRLVSH